jgi:hypothetical protein
VGGFSTVRACRELSSVFLIGYPDRVEIIAGPDRVADTDLLADTIAARRTLSRQRYDVIDSALADGAFVAAFTSWVDGTLFRLSCVFRPGARPELGAALLADFGGTGGASHILRSQPATPAF